MGRAIKKTDARRALTANAMPVASSSMIGERQAGRRPDETAFWIVVTSLVRRVTSDGT